MSKINPKLGIVAYYNQFSSDKPISAWGVSPISKDESNRGSIGYEREILAKMGKIMT